MDFTLTEEQILLKKSIIEFAQKELNNHVIEREEKGEFSWDGWKKCAEYGIQGMSIPKTYGGLEKDILTCLLLMEGLGYSCKDSGLLFTINSHLWTCEMPILHFGTTEQKNKYLRAMCKGELIGGHAMTEPDAGSDAYSLRSSAIRKGDRYILNGTKMFCSNAPIADLLIIFAYTDTSKGFAGLSAFIVEKNYKGFSVGKPLEKMGLRTAQTGEVILQDCEVPVENRLGKEGSGSVIFNSEMEWERSCLFACHLGAMESLFESCIGYSKKRFQFGRPIGHFQSIANKIVDMKIRIELSKLMLYKVAWMKDSGMRAPIESAIAKIFTSESYVSTSIDSIQIFGLYGYMSDYGIERDLRDSIAGKIYSGTSEIQRNIIARWLGL